MKLPKYKIIKPVTIRREPRIVEYKLGKVYITNAVGMFSTGDIIEVLDLLTDSEGRTWGMTSLPDASAKTDWFCIKTRNTKFAEPFEAVTPAPDPSQVQDWARAIDSWARSKGYQGPEP